MMYPIEAQQAIPPRRYKRAKLPRYPFASMEIGDKFTVKVPKGYSARYVQKRTLNSAYRYAPRKFTTRQLEDGTVGVWRIA
jgi:hypothetical protein